jgi:glycosyltransferase involved in cell wall biosynthesis
MRPKISIIVPVYNAGAYLRPCLDSLVNQTLEDIEIICVVDCPTDGSDKVVEEYASKYTKVRVLKNDRNLHIGKSRNRGIDEAGGEYISLNDHDDVRDIHMCEKMYSRAVSSGAKVVFSGVSSKTVGDNVSPSGDYIESLFLSLLSRRFLSRVTPHLYDLSYMNKYGIRFVDTKEVSPEDSIFNAVYFYHLYEDNENSVEIMNDCFYRPVDTGCNTNLQYGHWAFSKIYNGVDTLYKLMVENEPQQNVRTLIKKNVAEFVIKNFYTSFNREYHKFGLVRTLNLFSSLRKDPMIADIMSSYPYKFRNPNLRITKNIFAKIFLK